MRRMLRGEVGQQGQENQRVVLLEWGRVTETEPMPKLVMGYTEQVAVSCRIRRVF